VRLANKLKFDIYINPCLTFGFKRIIAFSSLQNANQLWLGYSEVFA